MRVGPRRRLRFPSKPYVDGQLVTTTAATGRVATNSEPLVIGAGPEATGTQFREFWNGSIADVQIYGRGLSQAEILTIFRE